MNKQTRAWAGEFGDKYTERNNIDYMEHQPVWREVMREFGNTYTQLSVLEVGCNRGHNLKALTSMGVGCEGRLYPVGIDVNKSALDIARKTNCMAQYGDILDIPFNDSSFDLVFTMGVLIHIAPENLPTAIRELYRVSNEFILSIEYPADEETEILYHGGNDMLWKRDFHSEFVNICPDLRLIKHWAWGTKANPFYDRVDGWLLKKGK